MKKLNYVLMFALVGAMTACSDDDDDDHPDMSQQAELRITHASPDAPKVNVYLDGDLALGDVDYKQSSGSIMREPGTVEVEVRGILADGSELSVIGPVELGLDEGMRTEVVAYDALFDGSDLNIKPFVAPMEDVSTPVDGVRIAVFHAAPQVADVDVYVTAPGESLGMSMPVDVDFGDYAGPLSLEAGTEYQVRITPDGSSTVVYDSGTLSFDNGTDLLLVAVENTTGIGENPVNLLAVGEDGANEVFDIATGAEVRVVHNSADTPAVDVLIDGATVLSGVTYPNASEYDQVAAPAGTYNVVVAATADNTIAPIDVDLTLDQAVSYTVAAIGSLVDETVEPLLTVDDRRSVATEARLRVVHGSYAVAKDLPVDVYLTETIDISSAQPAVSGLVYGESTNQLPLPGGEYVVTVTAAGDQSVVAFSSGAALALDAGVNYTVIARDPSSEEDPAPNLIFLNILTD